MTTVRPLTGLRIALSVGESGSLKNRGFTRASMSRLTVSLTSTLLAKGATLAFGHDWRQEGVMEAVCRGALDAFGYPGQEDPRPLVLNFVPWPDPTQVRREILTRMPGVLSIQKGGLPPDLEVVAQDNNDLEIQRYLRARGLTHLRQQLVRESHARICLGGREKSFNGRYPGILEEALFTLDAGQPLYLVGLLGGAAFHLGRAILAGKPRPKEFGDAAYREPVEGGRSLAGIYREWSSKYPSGRLNKNDRHSTPGLSDETLDLEAAWNLVCGLGSTRLLLNGLSLEENLRLLETDSEEEALHLVLLGLLRFTRLKGQE